MTTTLAQDLQALRALKDTAEAEGKEKKEADAAFKKAQARVLDRMEAEESDAFRTNGYLYSIVNRVKGQIEDRGPYIRWALENDPAIIEFLRELLIAVDNRWGVHEDLTAKFYEAITGTSVVVYKEQALVMNQQARSHVDDRAPLPPGLTFRPDPYVGMTKS